jgi:hypothetical protein
MKTKQKKLLDRVAKRTATIVREHLATLPAAEAAAMRAEIHKLAAKPSRSVSRGKAARLPKSADARLLSHTSAESA